jgi:hypothetical protein
MRRREGIDPTAETGAANDGGNIVFARVLTVRSVRETHRPCPPQGAPRRRRAIYAGCSFLALRMGGGGTRTELQPAPSDAHSQQQQEIDEDDK